VLYLSPPPAGRDTGNAFFEEYQRYHGGSGLSILFRERPDRRNFCGPV